VNPSGPIPDVKSAPPSSTGLDGTTYDGINWCNYDCDVSLYQGVIAVGNFCWVDGSGS
jgi:hypothetical protein